MSHRKRNMASYLDGTREMVFAIGEIDIMEYIDCWESKKYQINVHVETRDKGEKVRKCTLNGKR